MEEKPIAKNIMQKYFIFSIFLKSNTLERSVNYVNKFQNCYEVRNLFLWATIIAILLIHSLIKIVTDIITIKF